MPVESAVDPTRSANITVTWRRSAPSSGREPDIMGACGLGASSAIKRRIRRRSPNNTPSSFRSSSVRSGRIERSIRFLAKRSAYSDKPCEFSHSLIPGIRLSAAWGLSPYQALPAQPARGNAPTPCRKISWKPIFRLDLSDRKHTIITPLNAHNRPRSVAPHGIVDARARPVEIGTCGNANERRGVELPRRGVRKCVRRLTLPFDAGSLPCESVLNSSALLRLGGQPPRGHRVGDQGGRLEQLQRAADRCELMRPPCRQNANWGRAHDLERDGHHALVERVVDDPALVVVDIA